MKRRWNISTNTRLTIAKYAISTLIVMIIGSFIIASQGNSPLEAFQAFIVSSVGSISAIGTTLRWATPSVIKGIFCAAEPIVLCVAVSRGDLPPQAQDLRAFILEPGDVVSIARAVWHDACHGLGKSTGYYYLATAGQKKRSG